MDILLNIGSHIGLLILMLLLFTIGDRVFGRKIEGGKRLVLFVAGFGFAALGRVFCGETWHAFEANEYPSAFGFYFGVAAIGLGAYLIIVSIIATPETIDRTFDRL